MSNQVFSNETEIYPIFQTARNLKADTGEIYNMTQFGVLPSLGSTLTLVEKNSGTLEDPDLIDFRKNFAYTQDFTNVPAPSGAKTTVYTLNAGFFIPGDYQIDLYVNWINNFVGADDNWSIIFNHTDNISGTTILATIPLKQLNAQSSKEEQYIYRFLLTVPDGSLFNTFTIEFDNLANLGGQTKNRASLILNAVY
jgi:hypothetical protein